MQPIKFLLLSIDKCPEYFKDNRYILTGYRPPGLRLICYLKSIFFSHNETFNIWSHLYGAILYIFLLPRTIIWINKESNDDTRIFLDVVAFSIYLIGGILMYSCSVIYHVLWPMSNSMAITCAKVDYMGIVFMIWGSYYPFIRFLFYDDPKTYITYGYSLAAIAIACGCSLFPAYIQQPRFRWIRQVIFWSLGSVIPIVMSQGVIRYGALSREMRLFGYPLLYGCIVYLFGSILFATQVPEKYFPGTCDKCGSSHNIMHGCVLVASLMHYTWFVESFRLRNLE